MAKAIGQRLRALEQHQTEKLARMKYEQLIAYAKATPLTTAACEFTSQMTQGRSEEGWLYTSLSLFYF